MSFRFWKVMAASLAVLVLPATASAQRLSFSPAIADAVAASIAADGTQTAAPAPAFVYSDGYHTRAKIHRIGSIAMLPLLATQAVLGTSIYNHPTADKKTWHKRVAWGVGGLFAANSVTGTWNLIEGRKDPHGRKLRIAHGLLMLAADAGFVATAALRPTSTQPDFMGQKSTHRAIAFTSIGLATTGYLLMLFGHK
jgi:hypothetical protein